MSTVTASCLRHGEYNPKVGCLQCGTGIDWKKLATDLASAAVMNGFNPRPSSLKAVQAIECALADDTPGDDA